ncbi:MAG TPA: hypothetical protein VJR94_01935 [Candidatus Nitrosocosmicus sp.]|nr:hypothetical protein [Candidatus Nitrosocosmicus sp.]
MVVLWRGTVLFVNPMLDADSLPIVAGRSEVVVVGVCAFTIDVYVDIPIIDDIIASVLANKTK